MTKQMDKLIASVAKVTYNNLNTILMEQAIPEIKDIIYDDYNRYLVNRVTNRKSKARPEDYLEDFMIAVEEFEYLIYNDDGITVETPDMENFKFTGRLKAIEQILNGISGIYFEVDEESYVSMFGKKPTNEDPVDNEVAKKDRFYIVRHSKIPRAYKNKFIKYPFSNTPPIDIFSGASKYVDEMLDEWIDKALDSANYGGIRV